jgi:hypothetical protein
MVLDSLHAFVTKVFAAFIIFFLGVACGLLLIYIYDILYPPIQVTCWYCNEQSSLKARGEETANRWYCRKCENQNVRDEVRWFSLRLLLDTVLLQLQDDPVTNATFIH